ncbi:DUF5337 domain-containing protein [Profundibacter amoris]|uniref:DUF5337 domain-containing protein n=1 Tax=Profundibacter amoris TaxID=2171755 RepID=A0A347UEU4_9RHOB|nr:DUF5337 domain-containing protein [Profundibacter amoris]AXX97372.1 hypothetical protein BAR1_05165 [Profundibacter amoris]
MTLSPDQEQALARKSRMVAVVIAVVVVLWMGAQWIGGRIGLDPKFAFLFDLAALAAFFWTMIVTYQIWRRRRDSRG